MDYWTKTSSAALAADKTSVVSAVKNAATAATSAATYDISIQSTTRWGRLGVTQGVVDGIEMSDVQGDVAAVAAFVAADTKHALSENSIVVKG